MYISVTLHVSTYYTSHPPVVQECCFCDIGYWMEAWDGIVFN